VNAVPAFHGWSHISISVTDLAASEKWFTEVLGLQVVDRVEHEGWAGVLAADVTTGLVLEAQHHEGNQGERFDPLRTGLDHLGLRLRTRAELDEWQEHLEALGVDHTPVVSMPYGEVLTFRHPDGIQFEMFVLEPTRAAAVGHA
jgi:glyoxylase I family protein